MIYTDDELVLRLMQRDARAMEALYSRFGRLVYRIIYRVVREPATTEDLLQEAFWRVWIGIRTFDADRGTLEAWVATVARNRTIDHIRSARGKKCSAIGSHGIHLSTLPAAPRIELENFILVALERLKPAHRRVIDLVYFRGFTLMETSKMLQRPLPAVKTTVRSALKALRLATNTKISKRSTPRCRVAP